MKHLLLSAGLLALSVTVRAQVLPVDSASGKVSYSAVVAVPGATAASLYTRAKVWATTTLGPNLEIHLDDAEGRVFIGQVGRVIKTRAVVGSFDQTLWQLVHIEAREGRYLYTLTDFYLQPYVYSSAALSPPSKAQMRQVPIEENLRKGTPKIYLQSILEATSQIAENEVQSLKKAMGASQDW